ncbi:glycine betaine ABC transporter substrate-binding protein [Desulfolucanica intricata]|uniref:glycine betaine ABC transporter substrate-binding protein n=1 Tax=Desulfolucanica intricata TaxID=1285191 RepID=UPI000A7FB312|nr:glycine betaine ABC transporter substrate-binding protein [Desulfolucanica intricata]
MRKVLKMLGIAGMLVILSAMLFGCGGGANSNGGQKDAGVKEKFEGKIIGIEPGAGVMKKTESAIEEYGLDFNLQDSSSAGMAATLEKKINNQEWVIVTGWTPHWKWAKWDLKYLEDPKGVFGEAEHISTITRKGFAEDMPEANKVLDNFSWTPDDMQAVMLKIREGMSPDDAAKEWIAANQEKVEEWVQDVDKSAAAGKEIKLGYVEWDSEIASTHVVKNVLEDLGFAVKATAVDNAVMWQGVAQGSLDAIVSAWLPVTHGDLYNEVKDRIVDLGPNLEGAKIGLVVPSYVTIDSIEDLK